MSNLQPTAPITTATNFDLSSLHVLRPEIVTTLRNAELHLSEFNDDSSQAPLLLDDVATIGQVAKILHLIALEEGTLLAQAIADSTQKLYDEGHSSDDELLLVISEGIMTLNRYIDFVLLKETLEPSLILSVINRLREQVGQAPVSAENILVSKTNSLVIANPEHHYQSLRDLGITSQGLITAYRAGLKVALTATALPTNRADLGKLKAMQVACELIAKRSASLFWQAAVAAVSDLAKALPLTNVQKRALIFVEQQLNDYLPINDGRFADLVRFASTRDSDLAKQVQQTFLLSSLDANHLAKMRRILFGPDRAVADTLNALIQEQIDDIKKASDQYARDDNVTPGAENLQLMLERLHNLSLVFKTLNQPNVSETLAQQAIKVKAWGQKPTPADFDALLESLIAAENAAIYLAKSKTPGAANLMIQGHGISAHQLDTAYTTLIRESRLSIINIETAFTDYLTDPNHDMMHLVNVPGMMENIAGACLFLDLAKNAQMLKRTSGYLAELMNTNPAEINPQTLAQVADVIMAIDHYLASKQENKPINRHAFQVAQKSLHHLIAA